jgi:hypothetical protein
MDFFQHIQWRPEIGDPTFMGWLTVVAYAAASFTAWLAARRAKRSPGTVGGSRITWTLVAILMLLLCINKQLDLQSLFTDIGRVFAWKQGWYGERRGLQKWFILGVLATSSIATLILAIKYHAFWRKHFLLAIGLSFLLTFIVVRAISFHHFDVFLKSAVAGVRMNWFLELTGIALVWLAAILDYRKPKRAPKPVWKAAS